MDLIDQYRAKGDGTPATAATHRYGRFSSKMGLQQTEAIWRGLSGLIHLALRPANWSILEAYAKHPPKSLVGWYLPSGESRNGASGIYPGK